MPINSPNMNLPIPVVGVDSGPQYAQSIDNCLTIIDGHTHISGSGVPITTAAININANLPMNNFSLISIAALTLTTQTITPSNQSVYVSGVDLYYIDGNGNNIRVTQSGSVTGSAGTITGLPSGTASASYGSSTFVFQSATNTAANIDAGSFILRNNTANSFGLTLAPPTAMGANYALTLPAVPASTSIMQLDTSGNMLAALTVDNTSIDISANTLEVKPGANFTGVVTLKNQPLVVAQATSTFNLGIIRGGVTSGGSVSLGEGFTVARTGSGHYVVTFNTPFIDAPAMTVTAFQATLNGFNTATLLALGQGGATVNTSQTGTNLDSDFTFIAIGKIT